MRYVSLRFTHLLTYLSYFRRRPAQGFGDFAGPCILLKSLLVSMPHVY